MKRIICNIADIFLIAEHGVDATLAPASFAGGGCYATSFKFIQNFDNAKKPLKKKYQS